MSAPLSIIIPTLNAANRIGPTLACLAETIGEGLIRELIIADGGSTDAIADIADHAGATLVTSSPGRGGQLRAGSAKAKGTWLLFLHADTLLDRAWSAAVIGHLAQHPKKAAYFKLRFDAVGPWPSLISQWANLRSQLFHLPYGDQGLLISRQHYDAIGGHPDFPMMEDVAIARAIGRQMHALAATATTSAERYQRNGWLRHSLRNHMLMLRYCLGTDPEKLAQLYR